MKRLRSQVIHGDAHLGTLLRPDATSHIVCGLIDFGDMVQAPVAIDLAILADSFIALHEDPLAMVVAVALGFNDHVPLMDDEIRWLHDLVLARQVLSALLFDFQLTTGSSMDAEPGHRDAMLERMRRWLLLNPHQLAETIHGGSARRESQE